MYHWRLDSLASDGSSACIAVAQLVRLHQVNRSIMIMIMIIIIANRLPMVDMNDHLPHSLIRCSWRGDDASVNALGKPPEEYSVRAPVTFCDPSQSPGTETPRFLMTWTEIVPPWLRGANPLG